MVKEVLKNVAAKVLQDTKENEQANAEYSACIDRWSCNHETSTKSEDIFLSNAHELILNDVSVFIQ